MRVVPRLHEPVRTERAETFEQGNPKDVPASTTKRPQCGRRRGHGCRWLTLRIRRSRSRHLLGVVLSDHGSSGPQLMDGSLAGAMPMLGRVY